MIAETTPVLDFSVIICAYTDRRWEQLKLGYQVAAAQLRSDDQLIIVVDHNENLESRARSEFTQALVVANAEAPGLSGARNTGVSHATAEVVVFLDDDACPEPGWLDAYRTTFANPGVQVVSGAVEPVWADGPAPVWFPEEFGWVVGCDYRGLPENGAAVRNPIGANMAIRRAALQQVGGFAADVGRVGTLPVGCEETDLCIRIRQADPAAMMLRNTAAAVRHSVSRDRRRVRYFLSRCFYEGRSKAVLSDRVGTQDGLASERRYVTATLPSGVLRGLGSGLTGSLGGPLRSVAITAGFVATAVGFLTGRLRRSPTSPSTESAPSPAVPAEPDWHPLVLSEYRLGATDHQVSTVPGTRTRLLVTSAGSPMGFVDLGPTDPIPPADEMARRAALLVQPPAINAAGTFEGSDDFAPTVSVVVPTRGRSFELLRCVRSVLAVDYANFEVIVVDNNDRRGAVEELLAPLLHDPRLRVLHQPDRGVSPARNLGIAEARGEVIAATDDDVVVSGQWLSELVAPFADPDIACVTGLVLPNGFSSPAQEMFEEFGGFSKGFRPTRFDLRRNRANHILYPYSPGVYGSGNNMAYRRSTIAALGGYDRRLGPGTPARAGEDLDIFLKVLFDGGAIHYQPRAWVRHHHRDSLDQLRRQLQDYGRGLSAVMITWALSDPRRALDILRRLPAGLRHLLDPHSDKNEARSASYPAELQRSEYRGMVEGLLLTLVDSLANPARRGARTAPLPLRPIATTPPATAGLDQEVSHHAV